MPTADTKNILFDFGGVIIDLHIDRTVREFARLAGVSEAEMSSQYGIPPFFNQYEMGLISDDDFRRELAGFLGIPFDKEVLDTAWNAMLGKIPVHRINKIVELSQKYNVYLLSNTNQIHYDAFNPMVTQSSGHESLDILFKKAYYSHRINLRKPEPEIFVHVLEDSDLRAEETIFLDDTLENLKTAEALNFQTFHVHHPDSWLDLFDE